MTASSSSSSNAKLSGVGDTIAESIENAESAEATTATTAQSFRNSARARWSGLRSRGLHLPGGNLRWGILLLVVALLVVGCVAGIKNYRESNGASQHAQEIIETMDEGQKTVFFRNSLMSIGVRSTPEDAKDAAMAVCRQFDKGHTVNQVGLALLSIDNGMTPQQKGKFMSMAVTWWCPQHKNLVQEKTE